MITSKQLMDDTMAKYGEDELDDFTKFLLEATREIRDGDADPLLKRVVSDYHNEIKEHQKHLESKKNDNLNI